MNSRDDHEDNTPSLTYMMDLDFGSQELWGPDELGAVLEHQLSAPLQCDLGRLDKGLAGRLEELNSAEGPALGTFGDLLHHPHPPVELLELAKRFAKACRSHRDSPLPDEVATVLYFLSIAVALTKCGQRITKMDDASLRYSFEWALKQSWLDASSRGLLEQARQAIDSGGAR
jgi:hypothetical protein